MCFVCGTLGYPHLSNIAAFVSGKAGGERVVAMFTVASSSARLGYREFEPNWVQVKVGACGRHLPQLEELERLCADRQITIERIRSAMTA
jgi:hypothetical protein